MRAKETDFSVVMVNWQSYPFAIRAIESLKEHVGQLHYEIIIVDNNSLGPEEITELRKKDVKLLLNPANLGFSQAVNSGVLNAKSEYILVLNPDCILTPTSIAPLLNRLKNSPDIGIAGPLILDTSGNIVLECRRKDPTLIHLLGQYTLAQKLWKKLKGHHPQAEGPSIWNQSGPTECIQGSCFMVRKAEFLAMGGFDERIPLFLDDMDLCRRYRDNGSTVFFCSESQVIHEGSQSIKTMKNPTYSSLINFMAFDVYFIKHGSWLQVLGHHLLLFCLACIFLVLNLLFFIPLLLVIRKRAVHFLEKHVWMLIYSVSGCLYPPGFPETWPRSLFPLEGNGIQETKATFTDKRKSP